MQDADKGWIAGILDGEGCIGMQVRKDGRASVSLTVNTTSLPMAKKLADLWEELGAAPLSWGVRTVRDRPTRRPFVTIRITDMDKVRRVLAACRDHLTVKAAEADVMISYIDERQKSSKTWTGDNGLRDLHLRTSATLKSCKQVRISEDQMARL
jgi:hypothetical protein